MARIKDGVAPETQHQCLSNLNLLPALASLHVDYTVSQKTQVSPPMANLPFPLPPPKEAAAINELSGEERLAAIERRYGLSPSTTKRAEAAIARGAAPRELLAILGVDLDKTIRMADLAVQSKEWEKAEYLLREMLRVEPTDAVSWILYGSASFELGNIAHAAQAVANAAHLTPFDPQVSILQYRIHMARNEPFEAANCLMRILGDPQISPQVNAQQHVWAEGALQAVQPLLVLKRTDIPAKNTSMN